MNKLFFCVLSVCWVFASSAKEYVLPDNGLRVIGENTYYQVQKGDYFQQVAEDFNVGFLALMAANPNVDPFLPAPNTELVIPTKLILPFIKHHGIVINLAELRLYYFEPEQNVVHVFPVGIGREGLKTPSTVSFISDKRKDPVWRPTAEMKARYLQQHGKPLEDVVPPGENNPFGKYALRLGTSEYLIHGTNQRFGIGMRASSGCIRMFDADIEWLFNHVPVKTAVAIIDQPIKMSYEGGQQKHLEIHQPLSDTNSQLYQKSLQQLSHFVGEDLSELALTELINQASGLVVQIK